MAKPGYGKATIWQVRQSKSMATHRMTRYLMVGKPGYGKEGMLAYGKETHIMTKYIMVGKSKYIVARKAYFQSNGMKRCAMVSNARYGKVRLG